MLILARMNGGSIYSLSANGGEVKGYVGLGPEYYAQTGTGRPLGTGRTVSPELPDVRHPHHRAEPADDRRTPDVRQLLRHRTTGPQRTSGTCLRIVFGPEAHVPLHFAPICT